MNGTRWSYEEYERNRNITKNPFKVGDHVVCLKQIIQYSGVVSFKINERFMIESVNGDYINYDKSEHFHYSFFALDVAWYRKKKLLKLQSL